MKRLLGLLFAAGALGACLDFDTLVRDGCALDASWAECRVDAGDGGGLGGGQGGGAGGGGALGGGPGGDGGTGGGTGGGGFDDGGETLGCVGGTWCAELPAPFGAPDLYAVWGTSDDDVWVGGSGGALAHRVGLDWYWHGGDVTFLEAPGLSGLEPVIRAGAVDDAGVMWIAGSDMAAYARPVAGGTWGRFGGAQDRLGVSSGFGHTVFLSATGLTLQQTPAGSTFAPADVSIVPPPGQYDVPLGVLKTSRTFILYGAVTTGRAAVFSVEDATATFLQLGDGGPVVAPPYAFGVVRGREVIASTTGLHELVPGTGWTMTQELNLADAPTTHAFDSSDGGVRWWYADQEGVVWSRDEGQSPVQRSGARFRPHASWLSPQGTFWVVGAAGSVASVTSAGMLSERGVLDDYPDTRDIAVGRDVVVAVGLRGAVWTRTRFGWARSTSGTDDLRAVALLPDDAGVCTVSGSGDVACPFDGTQLGPLTADGGLASDWYRGAALAFRDDGTGLAAWGDVAAERSAAGTWTRLGSLLPGQHVNDVVLSDAGFALVTNATGPGGALTTGALVIRQNQLTVECRTPDAGSLLAVAAAADGGFLVAGQSVFGRCSPAGTFSDQSAGLPDREWTSVWVDPTGAWWLLDSAGLVLRRAPGGSWQRERLPIGYSGEETPGTVRITGDARRVFVIGKRGMVLKRPLP